MSTTSDTPRLREDPAWFTTDAGDAVSLFTLRNARGMEVAVAEWGASLVSVRLPPSPGAAAPREILLGWSRPADWQANPTYFGSTVGRFANRVARARIELDGRQVTLEANAGPHQLHGGPRGFSHRLWRGTTSEASDRSSVTLHLRSRHGDQGWPGNLDVVARYTVDDHDRLTMTWEARTDAPTHVNLTNHAYLNLGGVPGGERPVGPAPVHDHLLLLHASRFTPTDDAGIPTGEVRSVRGTPLDFTRARPLGEGLTSSSALVADRGGFDHNFVLDLHGDGAGPAGAPAALRPCARVEHPASGRALLVETTCPGVQLYTANGLDEPDLRGGPAGPHAGLCLETQFFPDTPHHPDFPSTRLDPGRTWRHVTRWSLIHAHRPQTT